MSIADEQPPAKFILASASPRRQSLLRDAGYQFDVDPAEIDEDELAAELLPSEAALKLAAAKAQSVAARHPANFVLAADTIVAFGDKILGKPRDIDHARQMLRLLSGTTHMVITGVALLRLDSGYSQLRRIISAVRMNLLSNQDIERYLISDQWRGKAGGYGIQDNDPFVRRMSGCHTNIVGLPMTTTQSMLAAAGIQPAARNATQKSQGP